MANEGVREEKERGQENDAREKQWANRGNSEKGGGGLSREIRTPTWGKGGRGAFESQDADYPRYEVRYNSG